MKVPGSLLRRGMPRSWIQLEEGLPITLHTTTVQLTNQPEMLKSTPRPRYGSPFDKDDFKITCHNLDTDLDVPSCAPYNVFADQMDRSGFCY
jgi:hypothetical protein